MADPSNLGDSVRKAFMAPKHLGENNRYTRLASLGEGGSSIIYVYSDKCAKGPEKRVAIKFLLMTNEIGQSKLAAQGDAYRAMLEISILWRMRHAHILSAKEVILGPKSKEYLLAIVTDYMPGRDVHEEAQSGPFSESKARWIFQQLILAVEYLHDKGFAHRDIKPENILIDRHKKPLIRLGDFGLAKDITRSSLSASLVGTQGYLPPEAMSPSSMSSYSTRKADIVQCGMVLFVMVTGTVFNPDPEKVGGAASRCPSSQAQEVSWNWRFLQQPELSADCRHLIEGLLARDPTARPGFSEIKHHPWFNKDVPYGFSDYNSRVKTAALARIEKAEDLARECQLEKDILKMVERAYGTSLQLAS